MTTKQELAYSSGYVAGNENKMKVPALCNDFRNCMDNVLKFSDSTILANEWLRGFEDSKLNDLRMKQLDK